MKQTLPTLAQFEKSSEEIAKYFTLKYGNNYHIIRQLQSQRKQLQTPLLDAKRTLRTIEESDKRTTSRQSDRMKATSSSTFSRPTTQYETFIQNTQHLDLNSGTVILSNLKQIMECLQNQEETPNFQLYWESVYEFKQESYIYFFVRPITQKLLQESILLSDISISFIQCQMKENLLNNKQCFQQEMCVISKLLVENMALFLNKMLSHTKQKNKCVEILQEKIDNILCRNNPCISFIQELKRNNSFIKNVLDKIVQIDNIHIQPVITTCRYQLNHLKQLDTIQSRQQLINAIYLSTTVSEQQEYQSPLKTLFKVPQQQQYIQHLRNSYNNLDNVTIPFIQTQFNKKLCVVLDLDETLGHFNDRLGKFISRPHLIEFLSQIHEKCEIILFTAGIQSYADYTIQQLECEQYIDYKLYRQHTTFKGEIVIKDLSKIGRPLEKTIIIDNMASNFELQTDNGLLVSSWIDQEDDKELLELKDLILKLVQSSITDVRKGLKRYRDYIGRNKK